MAGLPTATNLAREPAKGDRHDQALAASAIPPRLAISQKASSSVAPVRAFNPPHMQPAAGNNNARPDPDRKSYVQSAAVAKPASANSDIKQRLTLASLSDSQLGDIRGGLDTGSGVELNFAFQQATLVNHNVVQNVVLPTLTVTTNGAGGASASVSSVPAGAITGSTIVAAPVNTASFAGLGMAGAPSQSVTSSIGTTTIVSNGQGLQINSAISPTLGNGVTSVITTLGGTGLTNLVANTANNQLVQQMTTINIGISGLQQLLQQTVPASVMNQLNSANALHH